MRLGHQQSQPGSKNLSVPAESLILSSEKPGNAGFDASGEAKSLQRQAARPRVQVMIFRPSGPPYLSCFLVSSHPLKAPGMILLVWLSIGDSDL